jgi:glycosyltransferase 2 family protein
LSLALRTLTRIGLSLVLAAVLLAPLFVWGGLDVHELAATWKQLTWSVYLSSLGLHVALYFLRAVRFRVLMPPDERPAFLPFLSVCASHTMAAFVLPAKIGEATFVVYSKEVCGVSAATGIASLVVSRVLDLATLAAGFAIACFVLDATGAYPAIGWFRAVGAGLAVFSVFGFFVSARGDLLVGVAAAVTRMLRLDRFAAGRKSLAKATEIAAALRLAGGQGRLLTASLVSIPIWIVVFVFCAVLARGLGLPPETSLAQATFGASLAILTSLIPISAFANFGTLEAGWVLGFGVLGIPKDLAAATGLGLHVVQLVNIVAIGVVGHVAMGFYKKR